VTTEQTCESGIAAELVAGFADAWNRNDTDALARVFHEDAGFVDIRGTYVKGSEQIGRRHAAERDGALKDSVLHGEVVDARQPAPGVIVGHMKTELDIAGQTREAFLTFVLERRAGQWRFSEAQNTIVAPRRNDRGNAPTGAARFQTAMPQTRPRIHSQPTLRHRPERDVRLAAGRRARAPGHACHPRRVQVHDDPEDRRP
jgi:uncharacterized protein (TIGR02246 family)